MTQLTPPQDCRDMGALRAEIDALDERLVALLTARAGYIDQAIVLKKINGWAAHIPERVEEVVAKVRDKADAEGLDPDLEEPLWRELIDWAIAREARVIGDV